jgi:hypothetical protein
MGLFSKMFFWRKPPKEDVINNIHKRFNLLEDQTTEILKQLKQIKSMVDR